MQLYSPCSPAAELLLSDSLLSDSIFDFQLLSTTRAWIQITYFTFPAGKLSNCAIVPGASTIPCHVRVISLLPMQAQARSPSRSTDVRQASSSGRRQCCRAVIHHAIYRCLTLGASYAMPSTRRSQRSGGKIRSAFSCRCTLPLTPAWLVAQVPASGRRVPARSRYATV